MGCGMIGFVCVLACLISPQQLCGQSRKQRPIGGCGGMVRDYGRVVRAITGA